jgi:hypothetical protein
MLTSSSDESPFTPEELTVIRQEASAGTRKALAAYVRGALVGFVLLAVGVGYGLHDNTQVAKDGRAGLAQQQSAIVLSGQAVSVEGCNRDFRSAQQQQGLFTRLRASNLRAYKAGRINYTQYRSGDKFYADEYRHIVLPDCRKVKSLLTLDTPNHPIAVETPLYPGSPEARKTPKG